jgi:hypothetical protein
MFRLLLNLHAPFVATHRANDLLLAGGRLQWRGRNSLQAAIQQLVPNCAAVFAIGGDPESPDGPTLPTPTDVPVPEPHDVPAPGPVDVPPPEPKDPTPPRPNDPPPTDPGGDPLPRPIP